MKFLSLSHFVFFSRYFTQRRNWSLKASEMKKKKMIDMTKRSISLLFSFHLMTIVTFCIEQYLKFLWLTIIRTQKFSQMFGDLFRWVLTISINKTIDKIILLQWRWFIRIFSRLQYLHTKVKNKNKSKLFKIKKRTIDTFITKVHMNHSVRSAQHIF